MPASTDRLRNALRLADEEDDEDFVATTMDSWRLAASSMLFQPARVAPRAVSSPQPTPQPQPSEDSKDSEMVVDTCPSCRSNPIPIRPSRDSRPSTDQPTTDYADTNTVDNGVPILVSTGGIQSSLESVICSSNSSAMGAQQEVAPLDHKPSMQFPWCGMLHFAPFVTKLTFVLQYDTECGILTFVIIVLFPHRMISKAKPCISRAGI